MDDHFHGTHVSGTIGAVGNNAVGVIGVDPNVSVMGLKFMGANGSGAISDAIAAIDWAISAKNAGVNVRVLSNSWTGGGYSKSLLSAIEKAGANDILFVAAAGNGARDVDGGGPSYPCSYSTSNEICVAATDQNDNLALFSDWGATSVDLAAPGVGILSTVPGGGYAAYNGTSMATPHVAGTAALVLSTGYQPVATLKSAILAAVDPVASLAGRVRTGGRLDTCKAVPGCTASSVTTTPFSLSTSPARRGVAAGGGATYTVSVAAGSGFSGTVGLAASGLPPGAAATLSPTLVPASGGSNLSVSTSATTPPGRYVITITGAGGGATESTTAELRVRN
jgi:subtilisin family serine protease